MKLPILKGNGIKKSCNISLGGIDRRLSDMAKLHNAINLIGCGNCTTRPSRGPAMFFKTTPDQIIPCEDRLFFRYGNSLREVFSDKKGLLTEGEKLYSLSELDDSPDRKLFLWENAIYILPDGIKITEDEEKWYDFGTDCSVSAALPFTNSRTLFYTSGYYGDEICNDSVVFSVGLKLKFSWLAASEFTVVAISDAFSYNVQGQQVYEGKRVVLDRAVSGYNSLPQNATMKYLCPSQGDVLKKLRVGSNSWVSFSSDSIIFSDVSDGNVYNQHPDHFLRVGQTVRISGSSVPANNITAKITNISDDSVSVDKNFVGITEDKGREIVFTPVIPDFDFALITEDRLFGADNKNGRFWISALKNPFLFYDNPTTENDAWSVNMNEKSTGLAIWRDSVICYTETGGFRMLGYTALNFGLRQLSVSGIKKGCGDSLKRIGDMLFYNSKRGIMRYSGGKDIKISKALCTDLSGNQAVSIGRYYYLLEGDKILIYDPDGEIWWSEDAEGISLIFCVFGKRYMIKEDTVYLADCGGGEVNWSFETGEIPVNNMGDIQPYSCRIKIAAEDRSVFNLLLKPRGDIGWTKVGTYALMGEETLEISLPKVWGKGFRIQGNGKGKVSIEGIQFFYRQKSN